MAYRGVIAFCKRCIPVVGRGFDSTQQTVRTLRTSSLTFNPSTLSVRDEQNGVRRVTLDNPKKRNVLSLQTLRELDRCLTTADPDVRCIVLAGNGPVFSSGHDLKELHRDTGADVHREIFNLCSKIMLSIRALPVPVIAQVDGLAAAAGCQLVASCDIVVASENAQFSLPGATFGLFCSTPGIAVSRCVPTKTSAYMLLTGNPINAQEALHAGLVSRVVAAGSLQEETDKVVRAILSKSKPVLALGKRFYYEQIQLPIVEAYKAGEETMLRNLKYRDTQEGLTAFKEKREPKWVHSDEQMQ